MQTPWINYKVMKEISSEQKYNCQIEPIDDQASQQNTPYSNFVNDSFDVEKKVNPAIVNYSLLLKRI